MEWFLWLLRLFGFLSSAPLLIGRAAGRRCAAAAIAVIRSTVLCIPVIAAAVSAAASGLFICSAGLVISAARLFLCAAYRSLVRCGLLRCFLLRIAIKLVHKSILLYVVCILPHLYDNSLSLMLSFCEPVFFCILSPIVSMEKRIFVSFL